MKDVLQGIADRISGPLYGYISVSLVLFNWKWLALLFMSKFPVEVRIVVIEQYFSLWWGLVIPIISGAIAAILTPFFNLFLSLIHRWAAKGSLTVQKMVAADKAHAAAAIAISEAQSEWAKRNAVAEQELNEKQLLQSAVEAETNIKFIREQTKKLLENHTENVSKFRMLNGEISASLHMLEKIIQLSEIVKISLPEDEQLNELIEGRKDFMESWRKRFKNDGAPGLLQLNPDGFISFSETESEVTGVQ